MSDRPEPTGFVLVCPHDPGHTLGQVIAHPGTGWPSSPDSLDDGACVIWPALDRYLTTKLAARRTTTTAVPLAELPRLLGVPPATARALVNDGLPLTQTSATYHVALTELAAWTHTARGGPGRRRDTWAWRCWPCLRTGRSLPASSGGLRVAHLVRLAAARLLWTPRALTTVPATRAALLDATATVTPPQASDLDRATAYLTTRLDLRAEPPLNDLANALAWHPTTHPGAYQAPPRPASQAVAPTTRQ